MLLGITGTLGSGKGAVVECLIAAHGFKRIAVSDTFLREEAIRRGMEPDRIARRDIANEYRAKSPIALMQAVIESVGGLVGENIIIEPQHTEAEVRFIQEQGGYVLAVDADLPLRYERIKRRASEKDNVTYEQFAEAQAKEMVSDDPNKNNLQAAMDAADYLIENNDSFEALKVQVDYVIEKIRKGEERELEGN